MQTPCVSFDKMLHDCNNPPEGGKLLSIPDFVFSYNDWGFYGLKTPLDKDACTKNEIILKHKGDSQLFGDGALLLAIYVPVIILSEGAGLKIERDTSRQVYLSLPYCDKGYNKRLFEEDRLIIGGQVVRGIAEEPSANIPCKTIFLGFDTPLASYSIQKAGGLSYLASQINQRYAR